VNGRRLALAALLLHAGCGEQQWTFTVVAGADAGAGDSDTGTPVVVHVDAGPMIDAPADAGMEAAEHVDAVADVMAGQAPCLTDMDCPLSTLHCDPVSGDCFACVDDSQCTDPGLPRCDSALHSCVQCGVSTDCASGQVCEPTARQCVTACPDAGRCPASAPLCNSNGVCVGCQINADCTRAAGGTTCNTATGQCVQCVSKAQCTSLLAPLCNPTTNRCVGCVSTADCREGYCDPVQHVCVEQH
jgi:hypothetical protein